MSKFTPSFASETDPRFDQWTDEWTDRALAHVERLIEEGRREEALSLLDLIEEELWKTSTGQALALVQAWRSQPEDDD